MNISRFKKLTYDNICNEPIHPSVPKKKLPYNFEIPKIIPFTGDKDPKEHLRWFKFSNYLIYNYEDLMLHLFPMTLVAQALEWYNNLPRHSIYSFSQLANLFLQHFRIYIKEESSIMDLVELKQSQNESIIDFIS